MNNKAKRDISRKHKVLQHAQESGNVSKTCRYFVFANKEEALNYLFQQYLLEESVQ